MRIAEAPRRGRAQAADRTTPAAAEPAHLAEQHAMGRIHAAPRGRSRHRLHLLDVDLSWLARDRDHYRAGIIAVPSDHEEFVCGLAQRNQRWVDGTRILSPRLITDLLRWSGDQLDAYLGTVELAASSSVYWAGGLPLWFDLAREFTERWVHYRQILQAALPAGSTTRPTGTCPWCCVRSSGVSRTNTEPRQQMALRSPLRFPAPARGP